MYNLYFVYGTFSGWYLCGLLWMHLFGKGKLDLVCAGFLDPKNICTHKPCINVGSRAGDLFVEMWHKHAQTH